MSDLDSTIAFRSSDERWLSPSATERLNGLLEGLDRLDPILALPDHPERLETGLVFGHYRLRSRLGAGRFGVVLLADDPILKRQVIVKVPQPAVLADPYLRDRFLREARASARLEHPGIVPVFEAGEVGGLPFLAAAFVRGPTLRQWRREHPEPIPAITAAKLMQAVAESVHHAHERAVLHCDLAPSNILLQPAEDADANPDQLSALTPLVADFGLARLMDEDPALTQTFQVAGTPLYMSPEQARGDRRNLTSQTDVYALGVILYELLVGSPPFVGTETTSIVAQLQTEPPQSPRQRSSDVPRDLDAICLKCLEKAPQDRYASARALAEDLERFLSGDPVAARPVHSLVRCARWAAHNSKAAGLLLLASTFAVFAMGLALDRWFKELKAQSDLSIASAERTSAQTRAEALNSKAKTADFYATIERVRQRRVSRIAGWSVANRAGLRRVCSDRSAIDPAMVRTEGAAVAAAVDLGPPRSIAIGFDAHTVAFDPSGQILAIGGHSSGVLGVGTVRLVNPMTDTGIRHLNFPADRSWELIAGGRLDGCWSIAVSHDGQHVAVGTRSGWIVVWDLQQPAPDPLTKWQHSNLTDSTSPPRLAARIARLSFDRFGHLWSDDDVSVATWDPSHGWAEIGRQKGILCRPAAGKAGAAITVLPEHQSAAHPSGRLIIREERDQELIACLPDGHPVGRLALPNDERADDNRITDFVIDPVGTTLIATAEHAGHLKLWDLVGSRLLVARNMAHGTLRIAVDPTGRMLAVAESDCVKLFELLHPQAVESVGFQPLPLDDVDLTPDGRFLATLGACPNRPRILDVLINDLCQGPFAEPTHAIPLLTPTGNSRKRLAISPDGKEIVTHQRKDYFRTQLPAVRPEPFDGPAATRDIRFSPSGRLWAAGADTVCTWPNGTDKVARNEPGVASMVLQQDGGALIGRNDGSIVRYTAAGELLRASHITNTAITGLAINGERCVVGTAAGEVLILDGDRVVQTIPHAHADTIWAVAMGPGRSFATGSGDRQVRVWNADGMEVFTLPQTRPVRRLFWIDQGRTLAILAEGERAVRSWKMAALNAEFHHLGLESGLPDIE